MRNLQLGFVLFMRGATAWEGQIGWVAWRFLYPRFWRTSGLGKVYWTGPGSEYWQDED